MIGFPFLRMIDSRVGVGKKKSTLSLVWAANPQLSKRSATSPENTIPAALQRKKDFSFNMPANIFTLIFAFMAFSGLLRRFLSMRAKVVYLGERNCFFVKKNPASQ